MGETNANDVLRRKAKAGREEHQARVMSPVRAMRLALSRSAETLFELALSVTGVQNEQLGQDALLRSFDDDMLFIVLDGPNGALGAAALETSLVSGFVEKQTIGRVSAANGDKRIATATDAALVAPYVTRVLGEMSEHLGTEDGKLTDGFRFGARVETKRHLGLMIEAPDYQVLRAQLELEGGMRRGEIVICLPIEKPSQQGADTKGRGPSSEGGGGLTRAFEGWRLDGCESHSQGGYPPPPDYAWRTFRAESRNTAAFCGLGARADRAGCRAKCLKARALQAWQAGRDACTQGAVWCESRREGRI